MPRIAKVGKSEVFAAHTAATAAHNDNNDCAVRAIAAATNTPYEKVHAMMAEMGRRNKRGTPWQIIWDTLNALGFVHVRRASSEFIRQYPGSHATALKSVTTHHPDRFPAVWQNGKAYIFHTTRHVAAVVNGVNHDWTRGRACRVRTIWEIVPAQADDIAAEQDARAEYETMIQYEM